MPFKSYRDSHTTPNYGKNYDEFYKKDSCDSRMWILEKEILKKILQKYSLMKIENHLDFACGTGRLFEIFLNRAKNSIGIDVSEAMLIEARKKYKNVKFLKKDLTYHQSYLTMRFDIITAFRFFLNAENPLRQKVLGIFHKILKDNGFLIFNIHGNKNSVRFLPYIGKRFIFGSKCKINVLSYKQMRKILLGNGFEIIEVYGLSFLPQIFSKLIKENEWLKIDRFIIKLEIFNQFGTNLIFVCRKI